MPDRLPSQPRGRRDVIKTGILAGIAAGLPWQPVRADLREIARNRTMILREREPR